MEKSLCMNSLAWLVSVLHNYNFMTLTFLLSATPLTTICLEWSALVYLIPQLLFLISYICTTDKSFTPRTSESQTDNRCQFS